MLKSQRFSSLFRHYAKYHGLRKDDLEYFFVNALENEDTPESVQLQRGDTIMVRKKRKPEVPEAASDDDEFFKDMRELLDDEEHMDALFLLKVKKSGFSSPLPSADTMKAITSLSGNKRDSSGLINFKTPENSTSGVVDDDINSLSVETESHSAFTSENNIETDNVHDIDDGQYTTIEIRAHKAILTARADYFKGHFRRYASKDDKVSFKEDAKDIINVDPSFNEKTIRLMLEFVYTNRIQSITSVSTNDLMLLLHLSDMWLIRDLKRLVEHELIRSHMDVNTVARMYCATEDYNAERLARACIDYIMANIREVTGNVAFQKEMKHYPHLCIPVLRAAADLIPEQSHKKQRISDHGANATPNGANLSSPVPDNDP